MNVPTILSFLIQTVICVYDRRVITTLKYSKYSITPTVVNGKPAGEGQFPFLVSLKEPQQRLEPGKLVWKNLCGGSIIAKEKVLSAAHCFESDNFYYAKHPGVLRVVAGNMHTELIHTGDTETTADAQWRQIKQAILHDYFSFPSNDIAIAMLNEPWVYNNRVNYIRLASKVSEYKGQCLSAGYGRVGRNLDAKVSPVVLTADIEPISRWKCSLLWEMNMNSFICTSTAFTDVARGDSGGPLVCMRTGDPNEVNNDGILVGIVSGTNIDKTTLYTRVSAYSDWIRNDGVSGANKLRVIVDVCLSIILFFLIYLLFYCLVLSRTMQNSFVKVGASFCLVVLEVANATAEREDVGTISRSGSVFPADSRPEFGFVPG